jgi:hypothetical protein
MAKASKIAISALEAVKQAVAKAKPELKRASEVLAPHEGKILKPLQYDRMRVNLETDELGGPEYSGLSLYNPPHAKSGVVAAVSNKGALTRLVNQYKDYGLGEVIHTPMVGSDIQHRGNPTMFGKFYKEFTDKVSSGEVTQDQINLVNDYLNSKTVIKNKKRVPLFKEPVDVSSEEFLTRPLSFEQRTEFADVMSGKGIGGPIKGQIIDVTTKLGESIDPYVADAPVGAFGHRLVELGTNTLYDPTLHGDYPYHIIGKDLGVKFNPIEKEYMTDFAKQILEDPKKARLPTDMDLRTGNVSQRITPEWLQILKDAGNKDGGSINADGYAKGGSVEKDPEQIRDMIKSILGSDIEKAEGGTISDDAEEYGEQLKEQRKTLGSDILKSGAKGITEGVGNILRSAKETLSRAGTIGDVVQGYGKYAAPMEKARYEGITGKKFPEFKPISLLPDQAITESPVGAKILPFTTGEQQFIGEVLGDPLSYSVTGAGRGIKKVGKFIGEGLAEQVQTGRGFIGRNVMNPRANIIKDPGGMLVGGEKALDDELISIKKTENNFPHAHQYFVPEGPEREALKDPNAVALNAWIDTKVKKYIRNQAGSKDDPILKAIESGADYNFTPPQSGDTKYTIAMKRKFAGKDPQGIATTEKGKDWEYTVDSIFNPVKSSEIKDILQRNKDLPPSEASDKFLASVLRTEHDLPVYSKKDLDALQLINQIPDETVYGLNPAITNKLGLDHMTDVLMGDLRSGKLKPEQLNQMSIEKAIRRTAEYDAEKAKAMAKANASSIEGMPIPKEYDDGYKWVELKHETDPKRTELALKSEGEVMAHCVGDYCPEVESGEKKIYSLRGPDGKSYVTIEARPQFSMTLWRNANMDAINSNPRLKEYDFNMRSLDNDHKYGYRMTEQDYVKEMTKEMRKLGINPVEPPSYMEIHQVKGRKNKRPEEGYQSYISDFIKNNPTKHEIVEVFELDHTNLMGVQNIADSGLVSKDIHFHPEVEKAVKKRNAEYGIDPEDQFSIEMQEEHKYDLFKEVARDFARQNKNYLDKDDILNHIREKYLTPPKKAKGGSIDLQQEYKLENMRRRYG